MNKLVLIESREGAPFTPNSPNFSFAIPRDIEIVDLSNTSLAIELTPVDQNGAAILTHDIAFINYGPSSIIRTVRVKNADTGAIVEEIHHCNVLSSAINKYKHLEDNDINQKLHRSVTKRVASIGNRLYIPLSDLNLGITAHTTWMNGEFPLVFEFEMETNTSIINDSLSEVYIRAPGSVVAGSLRDFVCSSAAQAELFTVGESVTIDGGEAMSQTATAASISTTCFLTCDGTGISASDTVFCANAAGGGWPTLLNRFHGVDWSNSINVALSYVDSSGETAQPTTMPDIYLVKNPVTSTAATEASPCVITLDNTTLNAAVGDYVLMNGADGGTWEDSDGRWEVSAVTTTTISIILDSSGFGTATSFPSVSLSRDPQSAGDVVSIAAGVVTTDTDMPVSADGLQFLSTTESSATSISVTMDRAQLSVMGKTIVDMKAYQAAKNKGYDLEILTWTNEAINMPVVGASQMFTNTFTIDSEAAVKSIMLTPLDGTLDSVADGALSYRMSVDGEYATDRDVELFTSLYYDRLLTLLGSAKQLYQNEESAFCSPLQGAKLLRIDVRMGPHASTAKTLHNFIQYVKVEQVGGFV